MFLKKVLIRNYRLFRNAEFDFENSEDKNITMIFGNRETGKNTFFNAISWCLYGGEVIKYSDFRPYPKGICNIKTANLASIGDEIEVRVELEFSQDGETFKINRSMGYIKMEEGLRRLVSLDKFEIKTSGGSDLKFTNDSYFFIEKYFPSELRNYFLVDSQKLINDFAMYPSTIFKESVLGITQINLIGNIGQSISRVQRRYIAKQNKLNPQIGEKESYQQEIDEYQKKIDFCSEISESIDLLYNDLTETLRKQLQEFLKKNYLENHLKEGVFVDIIIGSDFNISLKNRFGNIINFHDLSLGERFILVMCFILYLHTLLDIDLPIIFIGNLCIFDQHAKNTYLTFLSQISENNQLIYLEYLPYSSYLDEIDDMISKKYILYYNIDDDGSESEVVLDN